ncbi:hypothetical protein CC80DRAFT_402227 [Byssothecium circinans]|uniref:Uncharacterized protein n=1 Tax=Byssothecium circinans TaxID=147558 RepID=A0A6A5U905_9PLEO|nr:hypothetical protein CC80DRAFT_402227 [Byssothecium circinans]
MCTETLGINQLIAAANKNDRLKLLNDASVLAGNLDNPIHPIFHDASFLEKSLHLRQALQLASLFIEHDSLLEFFIPLTYGRQQIDPATGKAFLTNPAVWKSDAEIKLYLKGVRKALHCLEHCVVFRWVSGEGTERLWGRTRLFERHPCHTSTCSNAFKYRSSVLIELNNKMLRFYDDEENGYRTRSKCDQFRHDFQLATTLIHELVHAYGAMRRGGLSEPFIRLDYPADSAEWGYAWENFMFGAIINPQDRSTFGTHVQLRKTWADPEVAKANGGKEYSTVPVRWTAQWFRKETWAKIEKGGPLAIPHSVTQLKFVSSTKYHRWVIMTDVPGTRDDISKLHDAAVAAKLRNPNFTQKDLELRRVLWTLVDSEYLQRTNVPIPVRVPERFSYKTVTCSTAKVASRESLVSSTSLTCTTTLTTTVRTALSELSPLSPRGGNTRPKRRRDEDETPSPRPYKATKL